MFSAITTLRFMSMICVVRYRFLSRLEASTTFITTSGISSTRLRLT